MVTIGDYPHGSLYPHVFIGLGGSGARVVERVAQRIKAMDNWDHQMRNLFKFMAIDTNELDLKDLQNIPPENRIGLQVEQPRKLIDRARRDNDKRVLRWLDPGYRAREGSVDGAGQIRLESRVGYYFNSARISDAIASVIDSTLTANAFRDTESRRVIVYLCASVAGGTGSGCFLSVAYLIADLIREKGLEPQVFGNLMLSTLFTDKVARELHEGIHANSYAALKELELLTRLSYDKHEEVFDYVRTVEPQAEKLARDRPFFMAALFDKPARMRFENETAIIADGIFVTTISPIFERIGSANDNYAKENTELTRLLGDASAIQSGFTKAVGTFGVAAMVVPVREIMEYAAHRFAADAVREYVTFSKVEGAEIVEEDNAIDYDDPRFLRMDEGAKVKLINRSYLSTAQGLARLEDEAQESDTGYWFKLVERVDHGLATRVEDEKGETQRSRSLIEGVKQHTVEIRKDLVQSKASIQSFPFTFMKENVAQYQALVNMLFKHAKASLIAVDEQLEVLVKEHRRGLNFTQLDLDPLTERYLLIRVQEVLHNNWLPEAERRLGLVEANWALGDAAKRELDTVRQSLTDAAGRWFSRRFEKARIHAQEIYNRVVQASMNYLEAKVEVSLLRAMGEFVDRRLEDYLTLSLNAHKDVAQLLDRARVLEAKPISDTNFALALEVLTTFSPESQRLWGLYYEQHLSKGAAKTSLFDRTAISEVIRSGFAAVRDVNGVLKRPTPLEISSRIREGLLTLGRKRLKPLILGENVEGQGGLTLNEALRIEAMLTAKGVLTERDIEEHIENKVRNFKGLVGLLGRIAPETIGDGVVPYKETLLLVPTDVPEDGRIASGLKSAFGVSSNKLIPWKEPFTLIGYVLIANIPMTYFAVVEGKLHEAYHLVLKNPKRSYNLHTDFRWELTLPDLTETGAQETAERSLEFLLDGLGLGIVTPETTEEGKNHLIWATDAKRYDLGPAVSHWVYTLQKHAAEEYIAVSLRASINDARKRLDADGQKAAAAAAAEYIGQELRAIAHRRVDGISNGQDKLNEPLLKIIHSRLSLRAGVQ